jgi:hypothetical protein
MGTGARLQRRDPAFGSRPTGRLVMCGVAALAMLFVFFLSARADAYSWMIKHGYAGCATCHADPSGGELLTRYGRAQSDLLLRMRYGKDAVSPQASPKPEKAGSDIDSFDSFDSFGGGAATGPKTTAAEAPKPAEQPAPSAEAEAGPSKSAGFLYGLVEPPEWLLLGGSYRQIEILRATGSPRFRFFPMMMDVYGQAQVGVVRGEASIGAARVPEGLPYARAAQVTTNQGDGWNLISRTHWVGVDIAGARYLLRAGRMNLPFGVRIPEHTAWVRQKTRTDRESAQQHGLALSYSGDSVRGELMAVAGNYQINPDEFRERGYSLFAEWFVSRRTALGISSLVTHAENDRFTPDGKPIWRQVHGALLRTSPLTSLVVLAEADAMLKSRNSPGYVGFAQADWEFVQGLHVMLTGETLDEGTPSAVTAEPTPGAGRPKFGGWLSLDYFFLPHIEARVDAVMRQKESVMVFGQLHVFL